MFQFAFIAFVVYAFMGLVTCIVKRKAIYTKAVELSDLSLPNYENNPDLKEFSKEDLAKASYKLVNLTLLIMTFIFWPWKIHVQTF